MARWGAAAAIGAACAWGGCGLGGCAGDVKYSQTELNALQVRDFDASYDQTFAAVIDAIFDAGYGVTASDKRGGLIAAQKHFGHGVQIKIDSATARRTSVRVSTLVGGQQQVDKGETDRFFRLIEQRLTSQPVQPAAPRGTGR